VVVSHVNGNGIPILQDAQGKPGCNAPEGHPDLRQPIRLTPSLYRSAAGRLARVPRRDREAAAERFVRVASDHGIDLSRIYATVERDGTGSPTRVLEACLSVTSAGRTASVFLTGPDADGGGHSDRVATIEAACRHLRDHDAPVLVQALPEPHESWAIEALTDAGFQRIGDLAYLRCPLGSTVQQAEPMPADVEVREVTSMAQNTPDRADLALALERSYEETLDCPELCGMRSTDAVIESHLASGQWDPSLWWIVRAGAQPAGCMLLSPNPDQGTVDLVYIGLGRALRRRGIAERLLSMGLARAGATGLSSMTCAVDRRNTPAIRLYERLGFSEFAGRVAFVRQIEPAR
jgi:mycothiol synthase